MTLGSKFPHARNTWPFSSLVIKVMIIYVIIIIIFYFYFIKASIPWPQVGALTTALLRSHVPDSSNYDFFKWEW